MGGKWWTVLPTTVRRWEEAYLGTNRALYKFCRTGVPIIWNRYEEGWPESVSMTNEFPVTVPSDIYIDMDTSAMCTQNQIDAAIGVDNVCQQNKQCNYFPLASKCKSVREIVCLRANYKSFNEIVSEIATVGSKEMDEPDVQYAAELENYLERTQKCLGLGICNPTQDATPACDCLKDHFGWENPLRRNLSTTDCTGIIMI